MFKLNIELLQSISNFNSKQICLDRFLLKHGNFICDQTQYRIIISSMCVCKKGIMRIHQHNSVSQQVEMHLQWNQKNVMMEIFLSF
ncbi:unnamed protein product [Paramecium primaurelia]|uniref:Uncharacterized protein n=1 Tax=Paramecium primaurelia TaxID=5886 RepID=A0A8S1PJF4_PARPR|nr:unnamed protein product [Paramecium primaurelia]